MNYKSDHLENKEFSFIKDLIFKFAIAICIILFAIVVMVYAFKFELYNVLTGSEVPYACPGDMIFVQAQDEYKPGDLIKFTNEGEKNVTHRLIAVKQDSQGVWHYICHGDAVQSTNGESETKSHNYYGVEFKTENKLSYQEEIEQLDGMTYEQIKQNRNKNIQDIKKENIDGKVVAKLPRCGLYFTFIKEHAILMIGIVGAIWCLTWIGQSEIDMKRERRMVG